VSTERTMEQLHEWMGDSVARVHRAIRNMREATPGFASNTPGNGDAPGGSGGGNTYIVERFALQGRSIDQDDAVRDLARLNDLARQLTPMIRESRDIVLRWGYTTAGEYDPRPRRQAGRATEGDSNRARWCSSCERLGKAEPVGERGRRGMCDWCATFEDREKILPPLALLDMRHRGSRITPALVERLRREERIAPKPKKNRPKRRR